MYCSCGEMSNTFTKYQKIWTRRTSTPCQFQVTSSKRSYSVVPNMELPSGNDCTTKPRTCCRKLANPSMVGTKPFWKDGTTALEDHSYIATRGARDRNEKSWVLKLNKEGAQGPMNQRPDFVEARREMKRLHDEHVKETSEGITPIHLVQRLRQRRATNLKDLNNIIIKSMPKQDGEPIL